MAESDKADSSTGNAKGKSSLLDEDMSKDFLSSWKSMSVTGGDDMDFNFEPVAKGKKKAFDFGMDMDFSLDDAFGKMPSFKLDMPDIDFSNSPKKSSKSKEKSDGESAKGSCQDKNDKFNFSFDFDRMDDFGLDSHSSEKGKDATKEKTTKQVSSTHEIERVESPKVAASNSGPRNEDATHTGLSKAEAEGQSKSSSSMECETSLHDSYFNSPSKSTLSVDLMNQTDPQISREKEVAVNVQGTQSERQAKTVNEKSYGQPGAHDIRSTPEREPLLPLASASRADSGKAPMAPETNGSFTNLTTEENFMIAKTNFKQFITQDQYQSASMSSYETSAQEIVSKKSYSKCAVNSNDVSNIETRMKSNDNPSSDTEEQKEAAAVEESETSTAPAFKSEGKKIEASRTEMVINSATVDGQAMKNRLPKLDCKRMVQNINSTGRRIPSSVPAEQEVTLNSQGNAKFNSKISSLATLQKSDIGQANKLSSMKIDKMHSLPSLKFSRNVATMKQSSASSKQDKLKSMGSFDNTTKFQVEGKMVSPVNLQKLSPSILSLKRKPSEAADSLMLHPSKRLSPNKSRKSNVSSRGGQDEVRTLGTSPGARIKNPTEDYVSPKFDFRQEANMEDLGLTLMVESDVNVEKAEACAKELDSICNMLRKKHEEAKELLVRALVYNNNLLMLNHPICEEKIRLVQRFASRLMSREQEAGV